MLNRLANSQWNAETTAHLFNRGGFGATPQEIQKWTTAGLDAAVSYLVDYDKTPDPTVALDWAKPDPGRRAEQMEMRMATEDQKREMRKARAREEVVRTLELRDWWLRRMAFGPRPLEEKMTLFWHGHFATSIEKVKDPYLMWLQNETLRRNALGSWEVMLQEISKDPAMLIWLDNARSNKNQPNENYAREVMELFSLGEGHYTEKDVKEAARALTGWGLNPDRQAFQEYPNNHDSGEKIFLGVRGRLTGADVVRQIAGQDQGNLFITAKLWNFFAGEIPSMALNRALADEMTSERQQFRPLMRVLFSSEEFYTPQVRRNQVKSPVQWLVGSVRLLERDLPPAVLSNNMLRSLGQNLFAPPNVKGWDGGIAWITTNSLLNRYNFSASLIDGTAPPPAAAENRKEQMMDRMAEYAAQGMAPANIAGLLGPGDLSNPQKTLAALLQRFIQGPVKEQRIQPLHDYLSSVSTMNEVSLRQAVRLLMSTPDYQLA